MSAPEAVTGRHGGQGHSKGELVCLGPQMQSSIWLFGGRLSQLILIRLTNIHILMANSLLAKRFAEFAHRIDHRVGISDNLARLRQHAWLANGRKLV